MIIILDAAEICFEKHAPSVTAISPMSWAMITNFAKPMRCSEVRKSPSPDDDDVTQALLFSFMLQYYDKPSLFRWPINS